MTVEYAKASYIPALNSFYLKDFSEETVAEIKALRERNLGGDKYLGKGIWEVSKETFYLLKTISHDYIDHSEPEPRPVVFTIQNDGKYLYQDLAAEELRKRENALLFFDTGTGKTRTTLLALSELRRDLFSCIVVGEANLSEGWLKQVKLHFPQFAERFLILNNGKSIPKRIDTIKCATEGTIFIINIESIRNKKLVQALNEKDLAVVVLDECQCIIGTGAKQTEGMHELKSAFRWALSATPIKNSPLEWHSLLAWLNVVKLKDTLTRFKQYYGVATLNKFGQWDYTSFRNEEDLEDLKNLVTIRVEKEGLGLLPRTDRVVELSADDLYLSQYKLIQKEKKREIIDTTITLFDAQFKVENIATLFYLERLITTLAKEKIDYILRQKDYPMVIVSCLKFPLFYINKLMPDSVLYHGDLSLQEREENLNQFLSGEKRVLLMTRRCGGTGLDGLQHCTNIMIFLDAPENNANFEQCADRLHRNGQNKEVLIDILKIKNSIDDYAWDNLNNKQSWIDRYYKVNYEEGI